MSVYFVLSGLLCKMKSSCDGTVAVGVDDAMLRPVVLETLVQWEKLIGEPVNYLEGPDNASNERARYKVVSWMSEVTTDARCEPAVFFMAVTLYDEYLRKRKISDVTMQLVACCCLLIASKVRSSYSFSFEQLHHYTENTISPDLIQLWEPIVCKVLNWNLNYPTAFDFCEKFIVDWDLSSYFVKDRIKHILNTLHLTYSAPIAVSTKASVIAAGILVNNMLYVDPSLEDYELPPEFEVSRLEVARMTVLINRLEDTNELREYIQNSRCRDLTKILVPMADIKVNK